MGRHRALAVAALCVALSLAVAGTSGASVVAKKKSPAYKLAVIDGEVPVPGTVRQYKIPLNALATKCTNKKIRLADMTVASRDLLRDGGLDYSLLEILQQVNLSIPTGTPEQPCEDIFSAWVVLTLP
jgi:hypothetical protein